MYNRFKVEVLSKLTQYGVGDDVIGKVDKALDEVSVRYVVKAPDNAMIKGDESWRDMVAWFAVCKSQEKLSKTTIKGYIGVLTRFFASVGLAAGDVKSMHIRLYLDRYSKEHDVMDVTLEHYRIVLNAFFSWAYLEGYIPDNPCARVQPIKCEKRERRAATQTELEKMRRACKSVREEVLIEFFYSTGCRIDEACKVRLSDIDRQTRTVRLHGKGKKERTVAYSEKCAVVLDEYLKTRDDDTDALFVNTRHTDSMMGTAGIRKVFKRICKRAGVVIVPHMIRHTAATTMLNNGAKIELIQLALGHEDINTTMKYAHQDRRDVVREMNRCLV